MAGIRNLRSTVTFIMCISFNYSTNIRKISDIKKSRGNYFAKKMRLRMEPHLRLGGS
jgi:hypothetical protein